MVIFGVKKPVGKDFWHTMVGSFYSVVGSTLQQPHESDDPPSICYSICGGQSPFLFWGQCFPFLSPTAALVLPPAYNS